MSCGRLDFGGGAGFDPGWGGFSRGLAGSILPGTEALQRRTGIAGPTGRGGGSRRGGDGRPGGSAGPLDFRRAAGWHYVPQARLAGRGLCRGDRRTRSAGGAADAYRAARSDGVARRLGRTAGGDRRGAPGAVPAADADADAQGDGAPRQGCRETAWTGGFRADARDGDADRLRARGVCGGCICSRGAGDGDGTGRHARAPAVAAGGEAGGVQPGERYGAGVACPDGLAALRG